MTFSGGKKVSYVAGCVLRSTHLRFLSSKAPCTKLVVGAKKGDGLLRLRRWRCARAWSVLALDREVDQTLSGRGVLHQRLRGTHDEAPPLAVAVRWKRTESTGVACLVVREIESFFATF